MFLSQANLVALTGYKRRSKVAVWLKQNGFVFVLGIDGWPRVSRAHFDLRMNGEVRSAKRVEPNMKALQELQR